MGYFDRIQKKARYFDADAGEYRWSAFTYTGSAAAGADYVNEEGLMVLYGANVFYDSGETGLRDVRVSTNFVNPLSSGNPSTARCYLYLTDPSALAGGDFTSPPPGCWGIASAEFEADTAGDWLSFDFTGLNKKPEQIYFLFTCSASNASQGSNQIYHYATGNYIPALGTGTRTPALSGGFTGGGAEGGGGYSLIDSGSRTGIFSRQDIELSRAERTASRVHLSFAGGGSVFLSVMGSNEDSLLDLSLYISDSPGFDTLRGVPTGNVLGQCRNVGWTGAFRVNVQAGADYYLFAVVERSGYAENSFTLTVSPESWSYSLRDCGAVYGLDQSEKVFTLSMGAFQTGRMGLSFDYKSYVSFSVSQGAAGSFAHVWLSEREGIQSGSGWPQSHVLMLGAGESAGMSVERGRQYYLFALYKGGAEPGSISVTVTPPPVLWFQGDGAAFDMLETPALHAAALSSARFARYRLSFAHTGTARIWTGDSRVPEGQRLEAYFCASDSFDASQGYPSGHLEHAYGQSFGETADLGFYAEVVAGKSYWLYLKNALRAEGLDTSVSYTLNIQPPEAHSRGYYLNSIDDSPEIRGDTELVNYLGRYTLSRRRIRFRFRGEAGFAVTYSAEGAGRSSLRGFLTETEDYDPEKGEPTGEWLARAEGEEGFEFSSRVSEERDYFLWIVCPEVYGDTLVRLDVKVRSPEVRYFRVTDGGEFYGLKAETRYAAAPGEGGVCLLELSFEKAGRVYLSCEDVTGEGRFMRLFVSDTAYLDALSGLPRGNILAESAGSEASPGAALDFFVTAKSAVCVFARDESVYSDVSFTLRLVHRGGAVYLKLGDSMRAALAYVYHDGAWRRALPCIRAGEGWKSSG